MLWTVVLEKTLESPLDCKEIQPVHSEGDQPWDFFGRNDALATSCEELTHWKRLWCWEGLGAGGEEDNRGWDSWMASQTRWTWVWVNSRRWWWTGRPGVLRFMGSQRVGHDWATELNWAISASFLPKQGHLAATSPWVDSFEIKLDIWKEASFLLHSLIFFFHACLPEELFTCACLPST